MRQATLFFSIVLLFVIAFGGCKKDNNPANPPPPAGGVTTFVGTLANATETGSMTLTFSSPIGKRMPTIVMQAESVITVSGSIKVGGSTIVLSGTYNTTNDSLIVAGGGYVFMGMLNAGHITGSYVGPNGPGSFSAAPSASEGSVKVYCGTYQETSPGTTEHGRFNLVVSGSSVSGLDDNGTVLGGSVSGNDVTITINGIQVATGTISGSNISGTYSVPGDPPHSGTWQAAICQ